jgi:hypothetical protein
MTNPTNKHAARKTALAGLDKNVFLLLRSIENPKNGARLVIASAAKQSIFRSNYLKEDGLPRPRRANARIRVVVRMHASE